MTRNIPGECHFLECLQGNIAEKVIHVVLCRHFRNGLQPFRRGTDVLKNLLAHFPACLSIFWAFSVYFHGSSVFMFIE
jgi:hypothetical protein